MKPARSFGSSLRVGKVVGSGPPIWRLGYFGYDVCMVVRRGNNVIKRILLPPEIHNAIVIYS